MAWKDGFVIEYTSSGKVPPDGKLSCKKCVNYAEDKSCPRKGSYIPELGFDSWKRCGQFQLSKQYDNTRNREALEKWTDKTLQGKLDELPSRSDLLKHKVFVKTQTNGICRVLGCDGYGLHIRPLKKSKLIRLSYRHLKQQRAFYCDSAGNPTAPTLKNMPLLD